MARRAGLRTVLVSNQLRWGEFDTPITLMFKDVDDAYYLKEQVADSRDDQLLPEVEKKLGEAGGIPTLLFIHLLGSHMPFRHRYPAEAALFPAPGETADPHIPATVRQLTAEYDNSIAFTDRLLDALLSRLKTLKRPAFLLYFSDHGEAFYPGMSDWVARDPDVNASYEIPFLLWFSPEYRKARPEAAARSTGEPPSAAPDRPADLHAAGTRRNHLPGFPAGRKPAESRLPAAPALYP